MKNHLVEDKIIVSDSGVIKTFTITSPTDEDVRKMVRRAVKKAAVPADLELRLWNSIRKMVINKV